MFHKGNKNYIKVFWFKHYFKKKKLKGLKKFLKICNLNKQMKINTHVTYKNPYYNYFMHT